MARGVPFIVAELGIDTDLFILHVFAVLSEKERKIIGKRTKVALAPLKAKSVQLGNRTNLAGTLSGAADTSPRRRHSGKSEQRAKDTDN